MSAQPKKCSQLFSDLSLKTALVSHGSGAFDANCEGGREFLNP